MVREHSSDPGLISSITWAPKYCQVQPWGPLSTTEYGHGVPLPPPQLQGGPGVCSTMGSEQLSYSGSGTELLVLLTGNLQWDPQASWDAPPPQKHI